MPTEMIPRLVQFQCRSEGTLFYYQTELRAPMNLLSLVKCCPICCARNVALTGLSFSPLKEWGDDRRLSDLPRGGDD
jgi:hypothetical protein